MEDELIHQLSAGYALDALTDEDQETYARHLASCRHCQAEVAAFAEATAALAYAAPAAIPPPWLRARVLAATRADRAPVRRWRTPAIAFSSAAACAAIVLGVWAVTARAPFGSSHTALHTLMLHGASGSVVVTRGGDAALVVSGVPPAPAGKTYEIWVMHGGVSRPAGTFPGRRGTVTVQLTRPVPAGSFVGVTVEPAGGSRQPSSPPLLTSTPA